MPGDVLTAGIRRNSRGVKSADREIRSAWLRDARVEAEGNGVDARVGIRENLVKVAHTEENLIGNGWAQNGVVNERVVLHVDRTHLIVVRYMRSYRRHLNSLAHEPAEREPIPAIEAVVQLDQTVVAETRFRNRTEKIGRRAWPGK